MQADGKIVVVGVSGAGPYSELNDFAVARYNSDGSLDQTFGSGGKVKTHFPGVDNTGSSATSIASQSDGKLIVGGFYKNEGTPHEFALVRYNSNGSLDSTFDELGDSPHAIKLSLARELQAIGDAEGARSLVEEVASEATGDLKTQAKQLLTQLA